MMNIEEWVRDELGVKRGQYQIIGDTINIRGDLVVPFWVKHFIYKINSVSQLFYSGSCITSLENGPDRVRHFTVQSNNLQTLKYAPKSFHSMSLEVPIPIWELRYIIFTSNTSKNSYPFYISKPKYSDSIDRKLEKLINSFLRLPESEKKDNIIKTLNDLKELSVEYETNKK